MGLEGLVSYKYVMRSKDKKGHVVGDFGAGKKQFKHKAIDVDGRVAFHSEFYPQ